VTRIAPLLLLVSLAVAPLPAWAQQSRDQITRDEDAAKTDEGQEAGWVMERPLPFKDGQTLRYFDPDGTYVGYAERHRLTIYFYDAEGLYVGKAKRVSQQLTRYYTQDGDPLGERRHKKMTLANTTNNKDKGFIQPYLGETPLEKH